MARLEINRKWGFIRGFLLPSYKVCLNEKDITEELDIEKVVKAKLEPGEYQLSIKTSDRARIPRTAKYDFVISSPEDSVAIDLCTSKWYVFCNIAIPTTVINGWLIPSLLKKDVNITDEMSLIMIFGPLILLIGINLLMITLTTIVLFYFNRFGIGIKIKKVRNSTDNLIEIVE